ncbi:19151_t:CDS:2, partial [Racocetra persica]
TGPDWMSASMSKDNNIRQTLFIDRSIKCLALDNIYDNNLIDYEYTSYILGRWTMSARHCPISNRHPPDVIFCVDNVWSQFMFLDIWWTQTLDNVQNVCVQAIFCEQ